VTTYLFHLISTFVFLPRPGSQCGRHRAAQSSLPVIKGDEL
jgi:hypothetical protein